VRPDVHFPFHLALLVKPTYAEMHHHFQQCGTCLIRFMVAFCSSGKADSPLNPVACHFPGVNQGYSKEGNADGMHNRFRKQLRHFESARCCAQRAISGTGAADVRSLELFDFWAEITGTAKAGSRVEEGGRNSWLGEVKRIFYCKQNLDSGSAEDRFAVAFPVFFRDYFGA